MMNLFLRFALLGWIWLFICVHTLPGQTPPPVVAIELKHVGPPAVSDSLIQANIRIKKGDPYRPASVDDDVRNLYGTGFFYNIRVDEQRSPEGITLTYVLQGKPVLTTLKFAGNKKYSNTQLLKKVSSKTGEPLDEKKLFFDAQEIQKKYQKSGYQKTTVKPVLTIDENAGRGSVVFEIHETPKVKITDISFEGAKTFSERKLRKVLKTKRRWLFSWLTGSAVLKDEQFEDDKDRLIEFYQSKGYIDFEIKDVKFDYASATKMKIRFVLSEGQLYKIGAVGFKGNTLFTTNDFIKGVKIEGRSRHIKMGVGETFTPGGLSDDVETLRDFYGSKGYIDARVIANRNPNVKTGTLDMVYDIREGEKSFIEKIEIRGNYKTKDKVIRRELAVSPGEVYDMVRVKLSRDRLEGLDFFQKVDTHPEETDVQNRKNLVVGVEEKDTGRFMIGAGVSSVDSVVGFIEVSQSNFDLFKPPTFTGGGQKFRLRTQVGTQRQDYQLSFVEPWFLDRKLALGVDLYHRQLGFLSDLYDETRTGASVSLKRALGSDFLIGSVSYTIESVGIDINGTGISPEIMAEQGTRLVSKVGASLAYDTRNSYLLPSKGQRTELLGELAGGPFGGDTDFYKLELKSAWYVPGFFDGHIFEVAGNTGVVSEYGDSTRVPIFDRWFLGGANNLRGFRYRRVGPRDGTGEPIGGNTYWFGSAEYSVPLVERLRFAMFYDIGNVYRDAFDYSNLGDYSDNWGFGLRINLPIGPLVLDYGIPITHPDNSGSGRFQFRIGYSRNY